MDQVRPGISCHRIARVVRSRALHHRATGEALERRGNARASVRHPREEWSSLWFDYRRVRGRTIEQRLSIAFWEPVTRLLAGRLYSRPRLPLSRDHSRITTDVPANRQERD